MQYVIYLHFYRDKFFRFFFERIPSKTQLDVDALTQFEISAPMSREFYTDLANSFLYLRVKITKANGDPVAAAPKVSICYF